MLQQTIFLPLGLPELCSCGCFSRVIQSLRLIQFVGLTCGRSWRYLWVEICSLVSVISIAWRLWPVAAQRRGGTDLKIDDFSRCRPRRLRRSSTATMTRPIARWWRQLYPAPPRPRDWQSCQSCRCAMCGLVLMHRLAWLVLRHEAGTSSTVEDVSNQGTFFKTC